MFIVMGDGIADMFTVMGVCVPVMFTVTRFH